MDKKILKTKREFKRITTELEVQYQPSKHQSWYMTYTRGLGPGGLCLISSEYLGHGMIIRLRFRLPGADENTDVSGEVLWCDFMIDKKLFESGIKFIVMGDIEKEMISNYIDSVLRPGPTGTAIEAKKGVPVYRPK